MIMVKHPATSLDMAGDYLPGRLVEIPVSEPAIHYFMDNLFSSQTF